MPRVSDEHRAARREQIVAAAVRCVAREGFHKTTMAHVIAESGLSAGAVYGYFRGKPELIRAIAERAVGPLAESLAEVARSDGPVTVVGALGHLLRRVERLAEETGGAFPRVGIHAWSEAARDDEVRELLDANIDRFHRAWIRVLERAVDDGTLPPGRDLDAMARALLGLLPGFVLQGPLLERVDADTYLRGFAALIGTAAPTATDAG